MLIKVCGIRRSPDLINLANTGADWLGLNFYKPSPRYFVDTSITKNPNVKYAGIFVRANLDRLKRIVECYELDLVQLHGDEGVNYCMAVQRLVPVIKVFRVDDQFDFTQIKSFEFCDYLLFDTRTTKYGGSGNKFEWTLLQGYHGRTPFLLSGGIGPDDVPRLLAVDHPSFIGVDINSRFELEPGIKDLKLVSDFVKQIKKLA